MTKYNYMLAWDIFQPRFYIVLNQTKYQIEIEAMSYSIPSLLQEPNYHTRYKNGEVHDKVYLFLLIVYNIITAYRCRAYNQYYGDMLLGKLQNPMNRKNLRSNKPC